MSKSYPSVLQDQSTSLEPPVRIGPVASRQDSLDRQYENGVPCSVMAKEPGFRQLRRVKETVGRIGEA
ncbi:MAG: hypothetical protein AUI93_04975 [Crenarchaeota archaeon 13_1_40CM_3_52_10]|nr:MAG: hypothetical protein AUI93_04975 [Crenarchaeota archaeon 13_1_40CM_3_52_10]